MVRRTAARRAGHNPGPRLKTLAMRTERLLAEEPVEFRGCYLHPSRPAIRDCINCERPVCSLCEEESGDPLLCAPCKEELDRLESGVPVPFGREDLGKTAVRKTSVDVSEVTVLADGEVIEPDRPEPPGAAVTEPEPEKPTGRKAPAAPESEGRPPTVEARKVKRPLPPELRSIRRPATASTRKERAPSPGNGKRAPTGEPPPAAPAIPDVEEKPGPVKREPARAGRPPRERRAERPARVKEARPKREPRYYDGPVMQVLSGLPVALGTAVAVSALWLLFAFLARQWSQVAVFTLGIAVPWSYYKGTTLRKKAGVPVWTEPPGPLLVAVPSLVIVAAITVPLQLLAFKVIYGSNRARLPFSDFMDRFFTSLDWLLLAFGLVLAFVVPFLLAAGGSLARPARFERRGGGGPGESDGTAGHDGAGGDGEAGDAGGGAGQEEA